MQSHACPNLTSVSIAVTGEELGTIYVVNCNLNAAALNALYTSLPTITVYGGIYRSGNPGAGSDTTSIATNKGWTIGS
jgi:hypothetical protein